MNANADLPALKETYEASKGKVIRQRDVIQAHIGSRVSKSLDELVKASDKEHHQMYCQYMKDRLIKISKMCADSRSNRARSMGDQRPKTDIENRNRAVSDNVLRADDEKM